MGHSGLRIVPISLAEANTFVAHHHRHHKPVTGHKYSIGLADKTGTIRGVAIIGRPVSRALDDGWTLEVNRVCTDVASITGARCSTGAHGGRRRHWGSQS